MLSYSWRVAVTFVFLLAAANLLVVMPSVHLDSYHASAAHGDGQRARTTSLFAASALHGWRKASIRQGQTDVEWARRILRLLWCEPSERAARGAWEAALVELAASLPNRSLLDRRLAAIGCRHACDDARLRSASSDSGQPECAGGLCTCDGGRSIGFDMAVARDEPSAAFFAAQVAWPAGSAGAPLAAQRPLRAASEAVKPHERSGLWNDPGNDPSNDLSRLELAYMRARRELARTAVDRSAAFARGGATAQAASGATPRRACAHLGFHQAFTVHAHAPDATPRFMEIAITPTAALLACRRRHPSTRSLAAADEAGGAGSARALGDGDTFIVRAFSSDVVLQSPILTAEPGAHRYSGYLFVADGGEYTLEVYWANSDYAGWFDVNERGRERDGLVRGGDANRTSCAPKGGREPEP